MIKYGCNQPESLGWGEAGHWFSCLKGSWPNISTKAMKVSWDDYSQYMEKENSCSKCVHFVCGKCPLLIFIWPRLTNRSSRSACNQPENSQDRRTPGNGHAERNDPPSQTYVQRMPSNWVYHTPLVLLFSDVQKAWDVNSFAACARNAHYVYISCLASRSPPPLVIHCWWQSIYRSHGIPSGHLQAI
jgi:hypothetical protein